MPYSIFEDTIADLTGQQVEAAAASGAVALLPIGVVEAHGPHLPTGTDAYAAHLLARLAKRHAEAAGTSAVIAPPFYWGLNTVLGDMPGSFRVRPEIAAGLLSDIIDELLATGFDDVLVVNHQGDMAHNRMVLGVVADKREAGHTGVRWLDEGRTCGRLEQDPTDPLWLIFDAGEWSGGLTKHGGATETALNTRYFPDLVDWDELAGLQAHELSPDELATWRKGGDDARRMTPQAYHGTPQHDFDAWRYYDASGRAMGAALVAAYGSR